MILSSEGSTDCRHRKGLPDDHCGQGRSRCFEVSQVRPHNVLRFSWVVLGVASSPFLLNATLRHHMQGYQADDPSFVAKFLNAIYVDDFTFGAGSVDEAFKLYVKSKQCLAEAGFNLRKFASNSTDFMGHIRQHQLKYH